MNFKLIDDKGRLWVFGLRINIIDFMVIIFILFLTPCFYYGWRFFKKNYTPAVVFISPSVVKHYQEIEQKYNKLNSQIHSFLQTHERARKYFNEIP